ncbi:MAG TPA: hypothetical protein VGB07_02680, partial [Blastocatellia bacterium]
MKEALSKLPLSFEANRGQTDKTVQYISRGTNYTVYLSSAEARFELPGPPNRHTAFNLQLAGACFNGPIEGLDPLPARSNYFIGNNPDEWQTDVPSFARVRQQNVYPGIDVIFYGNRQQLEYDFVVAPHANPQQIKLAFKGAPRIELDGKGDLLIDAGQSDKASDRQMRMHKPVIYQETNGQRQVVEGGFTIDEAHTVGF